MAEEKKDVKTNEVEAQAKPAAKEQKAEVKSDAVKSSAPAKPTTPAPTQQRNTRKIRQKRSRDNKRKQRDESGLDTKILDIRRVSRMYKGGRRMRLSVFVVVGDRKGMVGVGLGKGADVRSAQQKAVEKAKRNMISVNLKGNTIPHELNHKFGSAKILLKPAAPGTGIIAGSSMRVVAELAGIKDILGKILGTNNAINNAYATMQALDSLRSTRL